MIERKCGNPTRRDDWLTTVFDTKLSISERVKLVFHRMDKLLQRQKHEEINQVFLDLKTTFFDRIVSDLQLAIAFLSITNGPMEPEVEERDSFLQEYYQAVVDTYSEKEAERELRGFF